MSLEPGTRLGPYELVGLVGAGGMGEVYRARDSRLGRHVAVKVVRSRQQLLESVWPHSEDIKLRTVDVHIRTVRSAGYALDAEEFA
jgi:serine/threonine protein kinase